ncbi:Tyrosine recombinase XerC [Pseudomonas fluorescens]|uniref:Tyrosine recombinase XerC n=1 Tax=Pseudomonas fluorescens TaxID=294 RepID=A0A5E7WDZ1_PSEFL|nr:tyrosine-type recombinase/integrase [Pseudomonas fluorescens]VVQ33084.1 Tyrosine recombinase XerC [Pseudomonas fluorescens]
MQNSKDLRAALAGFHLDNPQADWESIRSAIREFAREALQADHSNDPMQSYGMVYDDLKGHLIGHAMTSPMTPVQARGVEAAIAAINGAQKRLNGDLGALNEILEDGPSCGTSTPLSSSLSVLPTADALTFEGLSTIYIKEHKANIADSTLKSLGYSLKALNEALAGVDLTNHTRADMQALKATLDASRSPSTVNKLLTTVVTILDWSVNNGLLERHYAKGLKHRKGASSQRKAFSKSQVQTIMGKAVEDTSEASLLIQLAVLTGARLNELTTLVKGDFKILNGVMMVDINKDQAFKSLKNDHSVRMVPLVGALGFNLESFLKRVENLSGDDDQLFKGSRAHLANTANALLRGFHGEVDKDLVFHSLRHSLASSLKSSGARLEVAQAILGHSSGSITWDLYGRCGTLSVVEMAEALRKALLKSGLEHLEQVPGDSSDQCEAS